MDDDVLLGLIRRAQAVCDPVPDGLVDETCLLLDVAHTLDHAGLTAAGPDPAGLTLVGLVPVGSAAVRGNGPRTLQFADETQEVLLRLSPAEDDLVRLDGWLTPTRPGVVVLHTDGRDFPAEIAASGRFHLPGLPSGPAVAWFEPTTPATPATRLGWRTPSFEL